MQSRMQSRSATGARPVAAAAHPRCRRSSSPRSSAAQASLGTAAGLVEQLRAQIATPAGDQQQQQQILATVAQIRQASNSSVTTDASLLTATWRLLWTTEKETRFICDNARWFGTKAGPVYQVIDVASQRLQNVITFPPSGAFIVDSSISVEGPQRVSFKFNAAKLKTADREFKVPPVGQGWFDTIYCDSDLRIAQDIRGDTLIVARDGPPRIFS